MDLILNHTRMYVYYRYGWRWLLHYSHETRHTNVSALSQYGTCGRVPEEYEGGCRRRLAEGSVLFSPRQNHDIEKTKHYRRTMEDPLRSTRFLIPYPVFRPMSSANASPACAPICDPITLLTGPAILPSAVPATVPRIGIP